MSNDFKMVVTVVKVTPKASIPKKSGSGSYDGTLFVYSTSGGEEKSRGFPDFQLQKNPDLVTGFARLKAGDKAFLRFSTDEKGSQNLAEVRPATAEDSASATEKKSYGGRSYGGGGGYKPKEFDTVGLQVGNALNGAAAVYASLINSGITKKFSKKDLASIVDTFLEVGTEARAKLTPKTDAAKEEAKPASAKAVAEPEKKAAVVTDDGEDDDEPFLMAD